MTKPKLPEENKPQDRLEEDVVKEMRFNVMADEVIRVCDNYMTHRYFDGIDFDEISMFTEVNRRMYVGRMGLTSKYLGYVQIDQLKRLSLNGVRVRIVYMWLPMFKYWQELANKLHEIFPPIPGDVERELFTPTSQNLHLTHGSPGRKPDEHYDEAYQRIRDGEDEMEVFKWYCEVEKIRSSNIYIKKSFKAAMRRRSKKA